MKFLPNNMEGKNLMPIHVYYTRGSYNDFSQPDILDFVYKDLDTGKKYVETIENPYYEIWIVKPEYRNYTHIKNFIKKDHCTCHRIRYKSRYKEAAKLLGLKNPDDAKISPYVFQLDIQIEHFYLMHFKLEYGNDAPKKPSLGYLDIESDMFQSVGRVIPGADPINCISFLDGDRKTMYTAVLRKDHIPHLSPSDKKYEYYESLRTKYYNQVDYFIEHVDDFIAECHKNFDESYGYIDYQIFMFEDEVDLITFIFETIKACSPDFWLVWNLPYDENQMIERLRYHGKDPASIISDAELIGKGRNFYFKEDKNPKAQKRRHISNIFSSSIPIDQLPVYAGIRVSRGSLQSLRLNQVAKDVLNDEKLNYSEYGQFKFFCYLDFWTFILYNIKDVLLQYGIESKNNDMMFVTDTICNDCVLNYEIFTTTITETMAIRDFAYRECNSVMGSNKSKMKLPEPKFSVKFDNEEDYNEEEFTLIDSYDQSDDDEEDDKKKKDEKFSGAYVMSPAHIKSSGTIIMGKENKYVHEHVIDEDIGAEYPSYVMVANSNNESLVGKVFLLDPDDVKMPFCNNFWIVDAKDEKTYSKIKSSAWVMELWSEGDVLSFGEVVLGLPSASDILTEVGDDLKYFEE